MLKYTYSPLGMTMILRGYVAFHFIIFAQYLSRNFFVFLEFSAGFFGGSAYFFISISVRGDLPMSIISLAGILLIFAAAFWLLSKEDLLDSVPRTVVCTALLLSALLFRLNFFDHQTYDYRDFLQPWIQFFRDNGGFYALRYSIGNYNVPYLYFLALFSYFDPSDWLYLIKLLSVAFDVLCAYAVMKLVSLYTDSKPRLLIAFFGILFLPTVVLNGSVWGQCDVIYAAFGIYGLYLALTDRPIPAMICFAASFAVKLQAVFLLPIIAVLWYRNHFKLWHSLIFPAAYVVIVLPAVLMGRPFWDTVTLYLNQTGSIGSGLNYNSSSVFAYFPNESAMDVEFWSNMGVVLAFAFMIAVLLWLFAKRKQLTKEIVLAAALLLCLGIPFILPHMHDRYFFVADVLSLAFAVVFPKLFAVPLLVQFGSLLGYHAYLKLQYLLPMRHGATALLATLVILTAFIIYQFHTKNEHKKNA